MKSTDIPKEAWAPGCYIDASNNRLYGADGKIYDNVQINRRDLERFLKQLKDRPQ
jgi:hypothetical protein